MVTSDQIRGTLSRARPALTASMLDECVIRRPSTTGELDDETGLYAMTDGDTVYSGACRLDVSTTASDPVSRDDKAFDEIAYMLLLPWGTSGVSVGDVVTMTTSSDPGIATHAWRVSRVFTDTFRTHQQYAVEEVQSDG